MPVWAEILVRVASCDGSWAWTVGIVWWLVRRPLDHQ